MEKEKRPSIITINANPPWKGLTYRIVVWMCFALFLGVYIPIFRDSVLQDWRVLIVLAVCFLCAVILNRTERFQYSIIRKHCHVFSPFVFIFMLIVFIQLISAYFMQMSFSTWDVKVVNNAAKMLAVGDVEKLNQVYFSRYQNNLGILFILSAVYRVSWILFHSVSDYYAIIFNLLAVDFALILTLLFVIKKWGYSSAFKLAIAMLFFSPFYLYIPIFYTDTLSMPFLAAVPLMVDSCCENKETENTSGLRGKILPIMLGILLFIGSAIKGSLLILLIAVSIYTILRLNWKRWLPVLSCVFLGFILSSFMWSTFVFDTGIVTRESSYEHKFPPQHWVMMGMQGRGNFNNDDVKYTASFSGYDKKVQATTKEIKRRADEMKICGLLRQAYKKATTYAWNYGTYYAERYLGDQGDEPVRYNWLHEFVLSQGKYHAWFYILTQGYYLFLFLGMVIGLAYAAMHKLNLMYFFQTISLLGCLIFFMLWETHPRYILHFSVFFITVGTVGWECVLHPKTS